jgi:hypothetical protein
VRTILFAASTFAACASIAGCSTPDAPQAGAAAPETDAAVVRAALVRHVTVVGPYGRNGYRIAFDESETPRSGLVTARRVDGSEFAATMDGTPWTTGRRAEVDWKVVGLLEPLPDGDPLPALSAGERLTCSAVGRIPGLDDATPRRGVSDVPPFGR